jgi:hypothetical protein
VRHVTRPVPLQRARVKRIYVREVASTATSVHNRQLTRPDAPGGSGLGQAVGGAAPVASERPGISSSQCAAPVLEAALYGLPLEEPTRARDAAARELRQAGERVDAEFPVEGPECLRSRASPSSSSQARVPLFQLKLGMGGEVGGEMAPDDLAWWPPELFGGGLRCLAVPTRQCDAEEDRALARQD